MTKDSSAKLAVLIDADNSSAKKIPLILQEVAKYGVASVKRVYGDWSSENLKNWRDVLLPHAITPVQQFAYTSGKDATDMMLIINAMDLLYIVKTELYRTGSFVVGLSNHDDRYP